MSGGALFEHRLLLVVGLPRVQNAHAALNISEDMGCAEENSAVQSPPILVVFEWLFVGYCLAIYWLFIGLFTLANRLLMGHRRHMESNERRTMTLNLTAREMAVLEELAIKKELSKTGVLRLALRLLQAVDAKLRMGHKLMFEDEKTKEKSEMVLI